ncbi:iron chelate uptake ABC transporter family permease subunit [Rhodococcus sp. X156]|uniref:iron chelate uptake ABC transporter family permease subunit n=1 Tax=Rhodococcus sp. X156 TaxID=2499145 RepID=UPI000FDC68D0|nr:iron chelate uptake ABC transporter family permease subunit [Rhodococcus sp. X156]
MAPPEALTAPQRTRSRTVAGLLGSDGVRLALLGLLALVSVVAFLTLGVRGNWSYVLERRAVVVVTMVVVGYAIALSTVLFQTVTNNQILTPSIMGFDSLYLLMQTVAAFFIGATATATADPISRFGVEVAFMVVFSLLLYRWLLVGMQRSMHLLVLVGIICGVFFRSISSFLQRLMDPAAFIVLQDSFFADFSRVDRRLLVVSALVVVVISVLAWRMLAKLDVMALGRETAVNLGVDHRRTLLTVLVMVTLLVSVATALVGPTTFFGLLVAHLAYRLMRSHKHRVTVPAAALVSVITLVGGQTVLERVFRSDTSLSIIVDFLGGLVFIFLLLRRSTP